MVVHVQELLIIKLYSFLLKDERLCVHMNCYKLVFLCLIGLLTIEDDRTSVSDLFRELKAREMVTSELFCDVGY